MTLSLSVLIQAPSAILSEKIEAQVGRQIITSTDVALAEEQLRSRLAEEKSSESLKKMALQQLVDQALIKEYLRSANMEVSDQDVERQLNSMRASQGIGSMEELRAYIETQGLSFASLKNQMRNQMEMGQFYQILQRQSLQSPSETDLLSYYQQNRARFDSNYEIELQECFVPANLASNTAELKKFESNPKIFSQCVTQISVAPSRAHGGRIGSFRRGELRADLEALVFNREKDAVISVPQAGGTQLLKIVDKKDLGPKSFEEVKEEISKLLEAERLEAARERVLTQLRATTLIKTES